MALPTRKREPKPTTGRAERHRGDLQPDETSESYRFIDQAAREGRRVPTENLSAEEVRAVLLGERRGP